MLGDCGAEQLPAGSPLGTNLKNIDLSHFFSAYFTGILIDKRNRRIDFCGTVFSIVDAFVGKKKLKDALSGVLSDVK